MPFLVLLVALGGLAITFIGFAGVTGRLPRNHFAGIRTRYTMASDENWLAVHRAAGPVFIFGGILVAAIDLAFVPFAFAGSLSTLVEVIAAGAGAGVMLGTTFAGWYAGSSFAAARDIATRSNSGR